MFLIEDNSKFSQLLANDTWKVMLDGEEYNSQKIINILSYNSKVWNLMNSELKSEGYFLVVGSNNFHYFIYVLLASILNIKIIFTDTKTVKRFGSCFNDILVTHVITPKRLFLGNSSKKFKHLKLDTEIPIDFGCSFDRLHIDVSKQAQIVFNTSGTTGVSKLVSYYEKNLFNNAKVVGGYMRLSENDKCLCLFPTNYMYGFSVLMSVLIQGGTVILERPTILPTDILYRLKNDHITLFPVLGSIVDKIEPYLDENRLFFPHLKIINAADRISVRQVENVFKMAPVFWNNFGQTESGPRLFALCIDKAEENNLYKYSYKEVIAVGYPVHPEIKILIKSDSGKICESYEQGLLYYKTIFGMKKYLNHSKGMDNNGWFCSGDIVYKNENGLIFWVGRESQAIKINGHFVNINLLSNVFKRLTGISNSYFVVENDTDKIYGFFVIEKSKVTSEDEVKQNIIDFYRCQLPLYPRLSGIIFVSSIPETSSGKVSISKLKDIMRFI